MRTQAVSRGLRELRGMRRQCRGLFWIVGLFSLFANLLMLTGPIYMLQVYDRVLGSGSVETLVVLSALVVFLYAMMAALDFLRGRIMSRIGTRIWDALHARVFLARMRRAAVAPDAASLSGLTDLERIRRLFDAPVVMAGFDLPWTPVFFAVIFLFHPLLGILALVGTLVLIGLTLANQMITAPAQRKADAQGLTAATLADQLQAEAQAVRALGMVDAGFQRWQNAEQQHLLSEMAVSHSGAGFLAIGKALRLLLQSAMLGLGAWLALAGQMTAGGMIAGSILLSRALAPIEGVLNQWQIALQAMQSWQRLATLLGETPMENLPTPLPPPKARVQVQSLTVVPPGEKFAALRSVSLGVGPGQAVGVIGPSGSGKTTLARALVGVWQPAGGQVRLDGAALSHYGPAQLGQHIGYLPQRVELFDGTIAENIARLASRPNAQAVTEAAQMAGAHEMILELPAGYDTLIRAGHLRLSGGQLQRIGLARALFGGPSVLVLDEPNANLDNAGSAALNHAVRKMKEAQKAVLIMAHRPAAIHECDLLLVLERGSRVAFGPKEDVLSVMVKNAKAIRSVPKTAAAGMG